MGDITPTQELDCRGLNCPLPVLKTKKAIVPLESGEVLKVIATDPGTVADMEAFSRHTKHEIIDQSEGGGEFAGVLYPVVQLHLLGVQARIATNLAKFQEGIEHDQVRTLQPERFQPLSNLPAPLETHGFV